MKHRILSILLAACMLVGMLPVSAYAEELPPTVQETGQVSEETTAEPTPADLEAELATAAEAASAEPVTEELPSEAMAEETMTEAAAAPEPTTESPALTEMTGELQTAQTVSLGDSLSDASNLPYDEEPAADYEQALLYGIDGAATFAALGDDLKTSDPMAYRIYSALKPQIAEAAAGKRASTKFTVNVADFKLSPNQENSNSIYASFGKAWVFLIYDCPYELYWFDKNVNGSGVDMNGDFNKDNTIFETLKFDFHVSEDFKGEDYFTINPEKIALASAAVTEAKKVVSDNAGKSDYQKLVAYKDYICDHASYHPTAMTTPTPYGDPWQMISVFDGNPETKVVCEGYAKAFKYLCDLSTFKGDVTCIYFLGMMGGGTGAGIHMWNIVGIDGKNYLVDLTNSDNRTVGCRGDLFLAGTTDGTVSTGYTFHIPGGKESVKYTIDEQSIALLTADRLTLEASGYVPTEQDAEAYFAREHMGENGWFTDTVFVLPPHGYTIGKTAEPTLAQLDITANGNLEYYLKNTATGKVLGPKTIAVKYDAEKPTKPTLSVSTASTDTTVTLTATATDATGGIQNYTLTEKDNKIAAQTCADGVFALTGLTPDTAYSFTVTAKDNAGNISEVSTACAVTTQKHPQAKLTITGLPATVTYGDSFTLGTAGGSGDGTVSWAVTAGPATVDATGKVTITGIGKVTVTATKAGNATYADATATADFTVKAATPTPIPTSTPTPTATPTSTPQPTATPATDTDSFVDRLYSECLGRNPDAAGKTDWVNALTNYRISGTKAAYGFVFSPEFQSKKYTNEDYVEQLYSALMGRKSDAAGKADWVAKLDAGASREEVFYGFANSAEFDKICNQYGIVAKDIETFVTRFYRVCLDRKPDAAGLTDWSAKLRNKEKAGRDVAYGFIFSPEFRKKGCSDEDYVEYLYASFLGRKSDAKGKANWVNQLKNGKSREEVFNGFVGSKEFGDICASYDINRG